MQRARTKQGAARKRALRQGTARPKPAQTKRPRTKKGKQTAAPVLTFRNRRGEDDAFIIQLTEEQLGDVHQQSFGEAFPRENFRQYLESGAPTTVIERDGKRIGYYSYLVAPDGTMHISALVLDPAQQSSGIGTEVMKRIEEDALRQGIHTLEVFVQASNPKSIAFTQKLGFREVYRIPPDTICFHKPITVATPGVNQAPNPPAMSAGNVPPQDVFGPYPF